MSTVINYLDLQHGQSFAFDTHVQKEVDFKNKKIPIASRLVYNDIISHSFKIEKNLSPQEMLIKIELKMYEDIGLDPTKPYKISYIEKDRGDENEILIEAFAIDKNALTSKYHDSLKSVKHIDFLAIPFLIFQTLYINKVLVPKNDIFIHLSKEEAFTASFTGGKYISSKRLKSFKDMVAELHSKNITTTVDELYETLTTKGLVRDSYELLEYELYEYLVETFSATFSTIKSLSLHNRNVYNFTQIDRIFFGCDGKAISGLIDEVQGYVEGAEFVPLNFFDSEEELSFDVIAASYAKDMLTANEHQHNMTLSTKKAPFYKSEVGKFALVSVASVLFLSAYPAYMYLQIDEKESQNSILKEQEAVISKSASKLKKELKVTNAKITQLEKEQKEDAKKLQTLKDIATSLLKLKDKDTKYTAMFVKINAILKNYKLSIDKITQSDEKALNFELSSSENRRDTIALLMQDLLKVGFSSVTSGEISLSDNDRYKSTVTVKR